MITERENYIRNATFNYPEWIPIRIAISDATWDQLREDLESVIIRHPVLFPDFNKGWRDYDNYKFGPRYTKGVASTDEWGCTWVASANGILGVVKKSPLTDWKDLQDYQFPDASVQEDCGHWDEERKRIENDRSCGEPAIGFGIHGFLFMRIQYLRGFENAMMDFAIKDPRLQGLIDKLVEHNMVIVNNYLNIGVDVMNFGEDLGTQTSTLLSPADFRHWIAPAYHKLMEPCKKRGVLVSLHSDGKILDILEDQIEAGVDIVNPQDLCNGIDNLAKRIKGKACIQLDIDRQSVIPFGTRKEIHELIEEEVRKLGSPEGGLEFVAGIYPPTPPENIDALFEALEKYRTYWWDQVNNI